MACVSLVGLAVLSFLLGAAVMYFRLPSASFLDKPFTGAQAWHERGQRDATTATYASGLTKEGVTQDHPDKTFDGFTLFTTIQGSRAKLIDMRGNVVHEWSYTFHRAWPHAPHIRDPPP